jgi:hypothetical protein
MEPFTIESLHERLKIAEETFHEMSMIESRHKEWYLNKQKIRIEKIKNMIKELNEKTSL